MARDYGEHLDEAALGLLAETTGFASRAEASGFFRSRPHDIAVALGRPEAARLLAAGEVPDHESSRLLQLAIAVHRTAEKICQAGWTTSGDGFVDLSLLTFSGQTEYQRFVVGLLASFLGAPDPIPVEHSPPSPSACTPERVLDLVALCDTVAETERAGALRLLGDEALFCVGVFPDIANRCRVDARLVARLRSVLPRAVVGLLDELAPRLQTLLDVHLEFGPIWYRMAAQNLVHTTGRPALEGIATDFTSARRFLVEVSQGPLAPLRDDLFPEVG